MMTAVLMISSMPSGIHADGHGALAAFTTGMATATSPALAGTLSLMMGAAAEDAAA